MVFVIAALLAACLGLVASVEICARKRRTVRRSDCLIVAGARVFPNGKLSKTLRRRCEAALKAYREGVAEEIVVCGGQGSDEPVSEGEAMRRYFVENGVDEARIHVDDRSVNTRENLRNARAIMDNRGWTTAAIVTSDYHVERALWLARDLGMDACGIGARCSDQWGTRIKGRLRESASWVLYAAKKVFVHKMA